MCGFGGYLSGFSEILDRILQCIDCHFKYSLGEQLFEALVSQEEILELELMDP